MSHDRYFVDELATRTLEVGNGRVESYFGNYEDFLRAKEQLGDHSHSQQRVEQQAEINENGELPVDKEARRQAHAERKERQRKERKLQKELDSLEAQIESLESEVAELEHAMAAPELYQDQERWKAISGEHAGLKERLEETYGRWEELQEQP